jgi:hypothetical protein
MWNQRELRSETALARWLKALIHADYALIFSEKGLPP